MPAVRVVSAIDHATKALPEVGQAMNCKELIEALIKKGLWTSPASAMVKSLNRQGRSAIA